MSRMHHPTLSRPKCPARVSRPGGRLGNRGLSIVEMMVGITIGLFILAGATMVLTTQLGDNHRLLLEVQMQQDLRAAAEMISRDVRRAGHWSRADKFVWPPDAAAGGIAVDNPYDGTTPADAPGTTTTTSSLSYARSTVETGGGRFGQDPAPGGINDDERMGFRFNPDGRYTIDAWLGNAWQALTDPAVMKVTRFDITLRSIALALPCGAQCLGSGGCPLVQSARDVVITIVAEAAHDPSVRRTLRDRIRLRNDVLTEVCAP